ncbi:N-6 DNA methylase [Variovorax sp. Varisp62]|uniref:N-6 DNA methylase n=1 Tax=Variovorax sp. Varisp62 TaxID=3243049 RepID=UPI0039B3E09C
MPIELDRYYTPENVAMDALERANLPFTPSTCVDSTCGSGRLLDAANAVFGTVECVGIDQDRSAIAKLRKNRPSWHLTVADMLKSRVHLQNFSSNLPHPADLLIINPPFSQRAQKSIDITYQDVHLKVSVAMAHLLKSLEAFSPKGGAIAVVPESLLYSEVDNLARLTLGKKYLISSVMDLKSCTFSGARVNSSIIKISPGKNIESRILLGNPKDVIEVELIRGSLPVHLSERQRTGFPYVHSTEIRWIVDGGNLSELPKTSSEAKGKVAGWVLLFPRVGKPDLRLIKPIYLKSTVQLSDCVVAVLFQNKQEALVGSRRIKNHWEAFMLLYRGTGAKYTTMARLEAWLAATVGLILRN